MMDSENITPEEKLLRVIENPDKLKRRALPALLKIKGGYFKAAGNLFKQLVEDKNFFKRFNLDAINKIAVGLSVILTLFAVCDFISTESRLERHFEKFILEASASTITPKELPVIEVNISELLAGLRRRNIFTFLPAPALEEELQAPAATAQVANILSTLKLVGIIWSAKPQAMIEDTEQQKTYLLGIGDEISQLKIKKIFRDRIIIGKEGQEWELR